MQRDSHWKTFIFRSFFSRKLNSSDRKFDKSFSGLKFSSLCSSHYLPVVTFKLFFSFNCLISPFSITFKIYWLRLVTGQWMQFCIKLRTIVWREEILITESDSNSSIKPVICNLGAVSQARKRWGKGEAETDGNGKLQNLIQKYCRHSLLSQRERERTNLCWNDLFIYPLRLIDNSFVCEDVRKHTETGLGCGLTMACCHMTADMTLQLSVDLPHFTKYAGGRVGSQTGPGDDQHF